MAFTKKNPDAPQPTIEELLKQVQAAIALPGEVTQQFKDQVLAAIDEAEKALKASKSSFPRAIAALLKSGKGSALTIDPKRVNITELLKTLSAMRKQVNGLATNSAKLTQQFVEMNEAVETIRKVMEAVALAKAA